MRIAHIICVFPPYRSGMGNAAADMAKLNQQAGHEVDVLTPQYHGRSGLDDKTQSEWGIKVEYLTAAIQFGNAALVPQLFYKTKKYDLVFLHLPFYGGSEAICLSSIFGNTRKLIIFYHMDLANPTLFQELASLPSKACLPVLMRRAEKILVSSLDYASRSRIGGCLKDRPEKFHELPFAVDTERFSPAEKAPGKSTEAVFLFVGGLDRAHNFKGLACLLEAFSIVLDSYPGCRLRIIGSGGMAAEYQAIAARLGIGEAVLFLGSVSDQALPLEFRKADIFILPSKGGNEAFGIVLLEALASGLVPIASRLPGVRTVFQDGSEGFYIDPGNIDDLSGKMAYLCKESRIRAEMSRAARALALKKYSRQIIGEKLQTLIS